MFTFLVASKCAVKPTAAAAAAAAVGSSALSTKSYEELPHEYYSGNVLVQQPPTIRIQARPNVSDLW